MSFDFLEELPALSDTTELPLDFEKAVHQALALWHADAASGSPLSHLLLVQDELTSGAISLRQATNRALLAALTTLQASDERSASLLRRRYLDERPVFSVANELNVSEPTFYRLQRRALQQVAAILFDMERHARADQESLFAQRAPLATASQLVGVDDQLVDLNKQVLALEPGGLVVITGLGGIGKTSLAHALAHRLVVEQAAFSDLAWISAQQQVFHPSGRIQPAADPALAADDVIDRLISQVLPAQARPVPFTAERALAALQDRLAAQPHLVVIDNLETLADVEALAPSLRRLSSVSKIVLTSRKALFDEPAVRNVVVRELSSAHALRLVRLEAGQRQLRDVVEASDDELQPIYDTVGGNPLALKLIVGQLYLLPLAHVLEDMTEARGKRVDELYRFIYWQSWSRLSPEAQQVLVLMPLFAQDGATLESIERVSSVKGPQLVETLDQLAHLSLMTVSGDFRGRRYSIHRLTETFLLREVLHWQGAAELEM